MARHTVLQRQHRYKSLQTGFKKNFAPGERFLVGGKALTREEILDHLQSLLDAIAATSAARAAHTERVAKQRTLERSLAYFVRMLGIVVVTRFGDNRARLNDFAMAPPKKTGPKTVKAKLEMVAHAKATRVARGTMGKRQRKKIKGKP